MSNINNIMMAISKLSADLASTKHKRDEAGDIVDEYENDHGYDRAESVDECHNKKHAKLYTDYTDLCDRVDAIEHNIHELEHELEHLEDASSRGGRAEW